MIDQVSRDEMKKFMEPVMSLMTMYMTHESSIREFTVPVSRTTSVKVKFSGPVGIDEYESLLAHVAYYKTLLPKEKGSKLDESNELLGKMKEIADSIWERRAPEKPED